MRDPANLRITRAPRGGYRLVTNSEPPAIVGNISHCTWFDREGWRYEPNSIGHRPGRKLWGSPEAALEDFKIVPARWAREQIAAVDAGEA
jgi:hypothetical protein